MLETIANFFTGIADVVTSLIDFVVGIVSDLVYVVMLCNEFVQKIPLYFSWLPTPIITVIVTIFAIVVIYKILGREG